MTLSKRLAVLTLTAVACGGKIAPNDALGIGKALSDGGEQACASGASEQQCGADVDAGVKSAVGHDSGLTDGDAPSPFDPSSACLGDDHIFVIGGDDNLHTGSPLTLRGGTGWSIATTAWAAGLPTHVTVQIQDNWVAEFSTEQLGTPLSPGKYVDAERAAFAEPNHPGLDVFGDGVGCNTVAGEFQILTIESSVEPGSSQPSVSSLTATFEQHCEAGKRANVGCVRIRL